MGRTITFGGRGAQVLGDGWFVTFAVEVRNVVHIPSWEVHT